MSVLVDFGTGDAVLATAINWFASLYSPIVVTYGWEGRTCDVISYLTCLSNNCGII